MEPDKKLKKYYRKNKMMKNSISCIRGQINEKSYSVGDRELLAVVWGLEKFNFDLNGQTVNLYTDRQAPDRYKKQPGQYSA